MENTETYQKEVDICYNLSYPCKLKLKAFSSIKSQEIQNEVLSRLRDTLPHISDNSYNNLVNFLHKTTSLPELDAYSKLVTSVSLYNYACIDVCYQSFDSIVGDVSIEIPYREEAAKYLVASQSFEYVNRALSFIIQLITKKCISTHPTPPKDLYTEKTRYNYILPYISRRGIGSISNNKKLRIPYDDSFVYNLQHAFFFDGEIDCGLYECLSGQSILQIRSEITPSTVKKEVIGRLLDRHTAEAADVVLRLGDPKDKSLARTIISSIAKAERTTKGPQTMYENSQNAHNEDVDVYVSKFIEKFIEEGELTPDKCLELKKDLEDSFQKTSRQIINVINSIDVSLLEKRLLVESNEEDVFQKATGIIETIFERFSIDTAEFTAANLSLCDIVVLAWRRINSDIYSKNTQEFLVNELFWLLVEMKPVCSTGYAANIINIFAFVDDDFRVSWYEQIKSNTKGRLLHRFSKCSVEVNDAIAMATMADADDSDKEIYYTTVSCELDSVKEELRNEFVNGGYVSSDEFQEYFQAIYDEWLQGFEDYGI